MRTRRDFESVERWPSIISDAILTYSLQGTDNEDLREWWQTTDAAECAQELGQAVLTAIETDLGYPLADAICRPYPQGDWTSDRAIVGAARGVGGAPMSA